MDTNSRFVAFSTTKYVVYVKTFWIRLILRIVELMRGHLSNLSPYRQLQGPEATKKYAPEVPAKPFVEEKPMAVYKLHRTVSKDEPEPSKTISNIPKKAAWAKH